MKSLLQQKLNLRNNLINDLSNLINATSSYSDLSLTNIPNMQINTQTNNNNIASQTGGKRYSQDELENLIAETTKHINTLFFQTQIESNTIRNQIDQLIKVKPYLVDMMDKLGYNIKYLVSEASREIQLQSQSQSQSGGASNRKKLTQSYVDKAISNISGQYLLVYFQAENEKQFLSNTYAKLLELSELNPFVKIGNIVTKSVTNSVYSTPPLFVSLKTLLTELNARGIEYSPYYYAKMLSNDKFIIEVIETKKNKFNEITIKDDSDISAINNLLSKIFKPSKGPFDSSFKIENGKSIKYKLDSFNDSILDILNAIGFPNKNIESIIVENNSNSLLKLISDTVKLKGRSFNDYINDSSNAGAKEIYDLINNYIINVAYKENGGLLRTLSA